MCGGDHYRNARIIAEEGTAIIEESIRQKKQLELLKARLDRAIANDQSHTKELSRN